MTSKPLYLGFDLSTQQLKAVVVDSQLKVHHIAKFDFDADSTGFDIKNGVLVNEALHEVYAPVALWLQALDGILQQLKDQGLRFSDIKAISGAGQQHGSVYWGHDAADILQHLNSSEPLGKQLDRAFSHPYSPNWQDSSTQVECDLFDKELSSKEELAQVTGSKAHHRFTGPQILRFRDRNPDVYEKTAHISLVSSFLASIFLGSIAPIDISDVCGMNLWELNTGSFDPKLLSLASNGDVQGLAAKLGPVYEDGGKHLGSVSKYFVSRWGFSESCSVIPFTGDNPATILALPLRPLDAMVSLGTSTTFLMSTPHYKPHPAVHFFNHPTTPGLYMFMLCFKNGGLAREQIRDAINHASNNSIPADNDIWSLFNKQASSTPILAQNTLDSDMRLGLYFPRPEIVPNVSAGTWRYNYSPTTQTLCKIPSDAAGNTNSDVRTIIESQLLSIRLRSKDIVEPVTLADGLSLPAQPRRIYLVGGGSKNPVITQIAGEVLGGSEGVWKLDVGDNACALGAAYKAVWAAERKDGETFEQLIGARWDESAFTTKVGHGYDETVFGVYGRALEGFERMERDVVSSMSGLSK